MIALPDRTAAGKPSAPSRFADHTLSRLFGLPPASCGYSVRRGVRIPMRDGVELLADHYRPHTDRPAGTVLVRCPYGRRFPFTLLYAGIYAARGYHVVFQSVRGTFGSGDEFSPMVHEIADGADTVAWLREQPWFTGSFATIGLSYLGFTQWALLCDPPPELAAAVITVGPHDVSGPRWGPGTFALSDFLGWSHLMATQEDRNRMRALVRQIRSRRRLAEAVGRLPAGAAGRELLGDGAPWWESWLEHPAADDPFWAGMNLRRALDTAQIPVLLIGGWQDLFLEQTIAQYRRLHERGVDVGLTVGPWTHLHLMTKAAPTAIRETLDWLGRHLGGAAGRRRAPVRAFVNRHGWLELDEWPPVMPELVRYLQPGGRLGDAVPPETAAPSSFTYNPADPTPTVGGRLLSPEAGYRRDDKLAQRPDVLSFTGDRLPTDLYVVGSPVLELAHFCDNPHNDLFVRISELDAKGRSRNLSDGYLGAAPDSGTVRIELDPVAHRLRAGSRIRVLVAGGSHPRFARNLGSGEPLGTGRTLVPATHRIHLAAGASRLILPAGPQPPTR